MSEDFNMKKSTVKNAATVVVLAIGALCLLCIGFAPQLSAYTNPPMPMHMPQPTLCINIGNITQNNGYYNASVTITNTRATTLQKLVVSPATNSSEGITFSNETSPDLTVYFNGTVENPNQLNYNLKSGDNLQVNIVIPSANCTSGTPMGLVITAQKETNFNDFSLP